MGLLPQQAALQYKNRIDYKTALFFKILGDFLRVISNGLAVSAYNIPTTFRDQNIRLSLT